MPQWTPHAIDLALRYVLNQNPPPPPAALYAGLFAVSAAPGAGLELTDPAYRRQPIGLWQQASLQAWTNAAQLDFAVAADGEFSGIGIFDALAGGACFFWHDYDLTYSFTAGTTVPVPVRGLLAGLANPALA